MGAPLQAKAAMITCVTCGLTYSVSQGRDSCARCPLHEDCSTSCCPKCGTSNINPDKSRLARWLQRILTPRLAQGTNAPVVVPAEAQNSSSKIRPLDFGSRPLHSGTKCAEGGGEGVPVAEPVEATVTEPVEARQAPTLRQAQGTDDRWLPAGHSVSEPVEARQAQGADSPLAEPVEATVTEPIEAQQSPALRQAQGADSPLAEPVEATVSEPVEARPASALRQAQGAKKQRTLADVQPGREVQITGYGDLNGSQRQHLQGYGLLPGRRVHVLSQHPVTIVQVEQTELAFERNVAARVLVGE